MNKAIYKYFCVVVTVSLLLCSCIFAITTANAIKQTTQKEMLYYAKLIDYQMNYDDDITLQLLKINPITYSDNSRITVIDKYGNVLGDTASDNLENHLDREEVKDAINKGFGYSVRYSNTMDLNMMYAAVDVGDYIIRLAVEDLGIFGYMEVLIFPIFLSVILSMLIAIVTSKVLAKKLANPVIEISNVINGMDFNKSTKFNQYPYDEYNVVTDAITKQANLIKKTRKSLKVEKVRINGILDQMQEGFILLNHDFNVVLVNQKANEIFKCIMIEGSSIHDYVFDINLDELLDDKLDGQRVVDIKVDKVIYACYVSKVDYGVTLLLLDVTIARNATKIRQEFLSNVSHELKTPLTSIKGYSELLQTGMLVDEEAKKSALSKIHKQVDNMSTLINDILTISRFESKDISTDIQSVNLKLLVEDIVDNFEIQINNKQLSVELNCLVENFEGNYLHLHQLLNNLIVNAIKYNKHQGSIFISIKEVKNQIEIIVQDTGVGIPLASKHRVFERFYRVDKGRDKESGGTGLGLAIVKHIVQYYKGYVDLQSEIDTGTTISVYLPL